MKKTIIAAVSKNGVIGKNGDIPWHYPEDLKHFKETTTGHPVIMGRKTFESLPEDYRPLPGRENIVLTRSGVENDEVTEAGSLEEAYSKAAEESEEAFVIGGESVYRQSLPEADRMILTRVHDEFDGDTYFPEWDESKWEEVGRDEREEISFVRYTRS